MQEVIGSIPLCSTNEKPAENQWVFLFAYNIRDPFRKNSVFLWQIPSKKMKKGLIFLLINLLSINLFAQEWIGCLQQNPTAPKVKLISMFSLSKSGAKVQPFSDVAKFFFEKKQILLDNI